MQQFGQLETDDPVKDPAGFLRMHQVHVNLPRLPEGFSDGIVGNFMECNPVNRIFRQAEFLSQMPGDGLPFAVRVGCEEDLPGFGSPGLQILHDIFFIF